MSDAAHALTVATEILTAGVVSAPPKTCEPDPVPTWSRFLVVTPTSGGMLFATQGGAYLMPMGDARDLQAVNLRVNELMHPAFDRVLGNC